ncbi:MAG TPA: tetratricopeptide repeat protein [Streptosporangiaceae bacterium]|nr:tetratricopeptide repeat protein [Streptosporangiaceae bacterium]
MKQPRDFSLHGAIDLGARQAAAQRRQRAAEQGTAEADQPGSQSGLVIDVTDETFNADVVARSRTVPVVLDLWADWCGPCKQLSPVLEKLATEANGAFVLAKVDVDANPQLSAALQVQSIPMVVAVVAGQVVDGFLGAMPEAQVKQWLGQVLGVAEQLGLPPAGGALPADGAGPADAADAMAAEYLGSGGPAAAIFAEAQAAMERGDMDAAAAAFQKVLDADPGDPAAAMGLAQVNLIRRVDGYDQAAAKREAASRPDDADAQARVADIDLTMGRIEDSFDRLLATIRRTSGEEREKARKHLLSLFEIFPPKDPRVSKARSALSSLLF